jgi:hypothetical protein
MAASLRVITETTGRSALLTGSDCESTNLDRERLV